MFNRFTERARKVIVYAKEEARRFNHDYIGTEHLLLGLIREGEGVAAAVLQKLGLDLETIRIEVEKLVQPGPQTQVLGDIPFTPKAKKVKYACAMMCVPPMDRPGKCPVCGMDMVPVEEHGDEEASETPSAANVLSEITLSPTAQKLAQLQVAPVERRFVADDRARAVRRHCRCELRRRRPMADRLWWASEERQILAPTARWPGTAPTASRGRGRPRGRSSTTRTSRSR